MWVCPVIFNSSTCSLLCLAGWAWLGRGLTSPRHIHGSHACVLWLRYRRCGDERKDWERGRQRRTQRGQEVTELIFSNKLCCVLTISNQSGLLKTFLTIFYSSFLFGKCYSCVCCSSPFNTWHSMFSKMASRTSVSVLGETCLSLCHTDF